MDEALAPYRPLAMRTAYTPLDARLTAADANSLIGRIRPRILCAPASRASASPNASRWQQGSRESVDHCITNAACGFGLSVLGGTRPRSAAEAALTLQPLPPPNRTVALQTSETHPLPITVSALRADLPMRTAAI